MDPARRVRERERVNHERAEMLGKWFLVFVLLPGHDGMTAILDFDRRVSPHKTIGRHILQNNASCRDHGSRSDFYSRRDETRRRDPTAVANRNRRDFQLEIVSTKIMAAGAKKGALTNADVRFDNHRRETENPHVFPDPNMIADGQAPGKRNVYIGSNNDPRSDSRPKFPQERDAKARRPWPGCLKEDATNRDPKGLFPPWCTAIEIGIVVDRKIHFGKESAKTARGKAKVKR